MPFVKHFPKAAKRLFKKWGKEGGERRTKILSPGQRRSIASQAAQARWGKKNPDPSMTSVRLQTPSWEDPVYLEEVLSFGSLGEWRRLYHQIADYPFGEAAKALEKVVGSVEIYGATRLWRSLLNNLQGGMNV